MIGFGFKLILDVVVWYYCVWVFNDFNSVKVVYW